MLSRMEQSARHKGSVWAQVTATKQVFLVVRSREPGTFYISKIGLAVGK